jgi:hypothetical protein
MIYKCAICGKEFDALWPDLYRYKRGGTFLCSWSCLRKYDNEKGSGNMARMKKDGTPAKKPGPKPAVELVYDESIAEEYRREQEEKARRAEDGMTMAPAPEPVTEIWTLGAEGYAATAIKKDGIGEFYYDKKHGTIDWENEYGEEISLLPADWMRLAAEIPKALKILGADDWT